MKVHVKHWNKIDDVPRLTLDWAKLVAGNDISIDDINDLVTSYEEYLATIDNKAN